MIKTEDTLLQQVKEHWKQLRGMSYDLLNELKEEDLHKKLPFPESQSIFYQFICMLGTTETFVDYIKVGKWEEWHCSLQPDTKDIPISELKSSLEKSDEAILSILEKSNLLEKQQDDLSPLQKYMTLVEHESHHQGQLINFIYALHLPIPKSWADKWALTR